MQDRQHINNDPLADSGWAQMQAQLDEVMPVRERRIFPWWILLLSIGVISSLGAYGWIVFQKNTTIDTQNEQKIKEIKATPVQEEVLIAQTEPEETFINTENNTSTKNASTTAKTLPSSSNISSILQEKIDKNNQFSTAKTQLTQGENTTFLTETAFSNTESVIVAENTPNEEPVVPNFSKREANIIAALEPVDVGLLKENALSVGKEVDFNAPKKSHLIILAGTETGFGGNPQGGSLGLAYQRHINKKITYEIDVSYQTVSIDLFSEALSLKLNGESNGLSSQGSGTGFFPRLSLAQAYNQLRINKMNLGVSASKKLGTRWSLGIGTQISYFAKAVIPVNIASADMYEDLVFDSNFFDLYDETLEVYAFDRATNLAGDVYQLELKRWQLSALFRAHYRISKHWEVEANYRKTLTKWPDDKNIYGASSFVGLGLRYYVW